MSAANKSSEPFRPKLGSFSRPFLPQIIRLGESVYASDVPNVVRYYSQRGKVVRVIDGVSNAIVIQISDAE